MLLILFCPTWRWTAPSSTSDPSISTGDSSFSPLLHKILGENRQHDDSDVAKSQEPHLKGQEDKMTQLVQQNCQQMYTTMFNQLYNQLYVVLYDVLYNKLYNQLYIDLYRTDMGQLSNTDSEAEPSGLGHSSTDTDSCSSMPRKRHRSHMGDEQYSHLMSVFDTNPNPTPDQI